MAEDIVFDVIGRDQASKTFDKIGSSSSTLGAKLAKVGKIAAAGALAIGAGAAVAGAALFKMTEQAIDDQKATALLAKQLKNSADATRGQIAATEEWITAQGRALGVTDDELRPALGRLVAVTHDVEKAQKLTSLAMDISAGTGKSLQSVTQALAKAQTGSLGGLSRLGVATKDAAGKTLSLRTVTKNLASTYAGQAKNAAHTAAGQFQRLKVMLSETAEAIGYKLLPLASAAARFLLDKLGPALSRAGGWAKEAGRKIRTAFENLHLGDVAAKIKTAFGKINISGIGAKLAKQAKSWAAPVIEGFKTGLDTGDWSGLGKALGNGILRALEGLGELVGKFGKIFGDLMAKVDWVGIGIAMGKQAPSLLLGLAAGILNFDLMGLLKGVAKHWQDILLAVLAVAFTPVKIIGKVGELLARIPLVGKLLQWGLTHFKKFADGLVGMVGKALGALGRAFMSGFRRVFPTVGRAFGEALKLLPTRLGIIALDLQAKGLKMLLGLAKAIGKGIVWVVEKIGELIGRILKPFADAATWLVKKGVDIISGLMGGIRKKVAAVWSFFKGIGAKILSAVSNFGSLLFDAGKALIEGLINGIKSMAGALGGVLKDIGGGAVNTVKGVFGIHSPSKVFHGIGVDLILGLVDGIESKRVSVRTVLEKLTAYISRQTDKIATLMGKRSDIINSFKDFGSSVFNMEPPEGQKSTAETLLAYQKQQLNKALRLKRDVMRLLKMGLSRSLIEQMAASGESGMEQIHALAQGSSAQVAQLNSLNAQTNQALAAAGTMAGNSLYASDIKDAKRDKAVAVAMAQEFRKVLREEKGDLHVYVEIDGHQLHTVLLREKKKQGKGLNLG